MSCWLFIAGAADSLDYARSERLGDVLRHALPSARVDTRPVLPRQWPAFLRDACAEMRFDAALLQRVGVGVGDGQQCQCVVWSRSGTLIGNAQAFAEFARQRYQLECDLGEDELARNAEANLAIAQHAQRVCGCVAGGGGGGGRGAAGAGGGRGGAAAAAASSAAAPLRRCWCSYCWCSC
jgi:hypothetical protein